MNTKVALAPRAGSTRWLRVGGRGKGVAQRQVASMSLFGLGGPELLVIGVVGAVLFGPSKLPELGRGLGKTVKSFQNAASVRIVKVLL